MQGLAGPREASCPRATARRPQCLLAANGHGRWQRKRDPRCRSASDASFSLGMQTGVELHSPDTAQAEQRTASRGSWGRLQEDDGVVDDAPPPPQPRGAPLPLKINTDLRLVGCASRRTGSIVKAPAMLAAATLQCTVPSGSACNCWWQRRAAAGPGR